MKLIRSFILGLSLTLSFLAVSANAHADITDVDNVSLAKLIEQNIPVIDVRRPDEWAATGTIEGSHLMTFFDKNGRYDAQAWLTDFDKIVSVDEPFILICAAGIRSRNIAQLLDIRVGYTAVHNLKQGINHWIATGQPVVPYSP